LVNIIEKDGIITLDGQHFDLKIDNNRKIYIKRKSERQFRGLDEEVEVGMTSQQKQQYLYELYSLILKKLQDRQGQSVGQRSPLETTKPKENTDSKKTMPEPELSENQQKDIKVR